MTFADCPIGYSGGMLMPGRSFKPSSYRYGFNGKENDNEVKGEGNQQDYGMRIYDPRLGRFLSFDPLSAEYPWFTPYQFASNKPIQNIDLDGLEGWELSTVKQHLQTQAKLEQQAHYNKRKLEEQRLTAMVKRLQVLPPTQVSQAKQYTPFNAQLHEEMKARLNSERGYNPDGTPKPLTKLAQNETFNKFADNLALPMVEMAIGDGLAKISFWGMRLFVKEITATAGKTTTVLGRLPDIEPLRKLSNVKSGMNEGGFNILKIPDEYYNWAANEKWLTRAIERNDIIKVVSDPLDNANIWVDGVVGGKKTTFGQEVELLERNGYKYIKDKMEFAKSSK